MSSANNRSGDQPRSDIQAAIDAGRTIGTTAATVRFIERDPSKTPMVVVPDGFRVEVLDELMPKTPRSYSTSMLLGDVESFIRATNEWRAAPRQLAAGSIERTRRLYYRIDTPQFFTVFNDHDGGAPDWRDYEAVYKCPLSREWRAWTEASGKGKSQVEFARFIEDNLPDIVRPTAADMLELSRTLEAKQAVNFRSATRLQNGANELVYEQTIDATASKGQLQIPDTFDIGIPVFHNGPVYKVEARFRYRIADGVLRLWFELVRPHKILEHAVTEVRDRIQKETGLQAYLLSAE